MPGLMSKPVARQVLKLVGWAYKSVMLDELATISKERLFVRKASTLVLASWNSWLWNAELF
jgi:hypothetical protein